MHNTKKKVLIWSCCVGFLFFFLKRRETHLRLRFVNYRSSLHCFFFSFESCVLWFYFLQKIYGFSFYAMHVSNFLWVISAFYVWFLFVLIWRKYSSFFECFVVLMVMVRFAILISEFQVKIFIQTWPVHGVSLDVSIEHLLSIHAHT